MGENIEPTAAQADAVARVLAWLDDPDGEQVFRLFGYAGTGKTTTLRSVLDAIDECRPELKTWLACPTGKAAYVLEGKTGRKATTLHKPGYIYKPVSMIPLAELRVDWVRDKKYQVVSLIESRLSGVDLVVIDEASMVARQVHDDMLRPRGMLGGAGRRLRVLAVGDPAQLPPVFGREAAYTAEGVAGDVVLRDVLRTDGGPVLSAATWLRDHERVDWGAPELRALKRREVPVGRLAAADAVIVNSNAERLSLSGRIRRHVGKPEFEPVPGDRIMFRANQLAANIVNGMVALVAKYGVHSDGYSQQLVFDSVAEVDRIERDGVALWSMKVRDGDVTILTPIDIFTAEYPTDERLTPMPEVRLGDGEVLAPVQFAHAMTAHSSQGSEFRDVVIINSPKTSWRWLYTAVTRASVAAVVADVVTDGEVDDSEFLGAWLRAVEGSEVPGAAKGFASSLASLGTRRLIGVRGIAAELSVGKSSVDRHMRALTKAGFVEGQTLVLPA